METAALRIGCKVNLTLRITGVRPNGWHELDTVFLPLDEPSDTLRLALRPGGGLALHCAEPGIDPEHFIICPNRFVRYPEAFQKHDCLLIGETLWTQSNQEKFGYFNRPKEKLLNVYRDFRRLLYEPNKIDSLLYRNKKGNDQK